MPYIVTTKRHHAITADPGCDDLIAVSRRAVATLEEAKARARFAAPETPDGLTAGFDAINALSESGGTVGPLPDGTVIEVEPVMWQFLWSESPLVSRALLRRAIDGDETAQQTILDAYNARHPRGREPEGT